jgi:hypothetical protein
MLKRSFLFTIAFLAGTCIHAQKNVSIHFVHEYDGEPIAFDQDFTDWAGRTIQLTRAEMYLSELELVHDGGQILDLSSEYLLVRTNVTSIPVGNHNITSLESVNFSVGVDTASNHVDPLLFPATHPLAMQVPTMHWGWAGGYRFLILHGKVDVDGDNVAETNFELQAIGDVLLTPVSLSTSGATNGNNNLQVWITIDYSGWLENMNLNVVGSTHGEMAPIPEMMTNTADFNVFSVPVNVGINDEHIVPNFVNVDYTFAMSPQLNYHMNSNEVSVMITDMTGKVVAQKNGLPAEGSYTISEGLATGIYSATFFSGDLYLKTEKVRVVR